MLKRKTVDSLMSYKI